MWIRPADVLKRFKAAEKSVLENAEFPKQDDLRAHSDDVEIHSERFLRRKNFRMKLYIFETRKEKILHRRWWICETWGRSCETAAIGRIYTLGEYLENVFFHPKLWRKCCAECRQFYRKRKFKFSVYHFYIFRSWLSFQVLAAALYKQAPPHKLVMQWSATVRKIAFVLLERKTPPCDTYKPNGSEREWEHFVEYLRAPGKWEYGTTTIRRTSAGARVKLQHHPRNKWLMGERVPSCSFQHASHYFTKPNWSKYGILRIPAAVLLYHSALI